MTRGALYNEIDPFCCDVLRARVADGSLPAGDVDDRDVRLVHPDELRDYGQIHLFAGIGGGALACRLAGVPDDFRIITAGVPCQPASQAGKRLGSFDDRWLWPEFFRLLRGLRSHCALVEQPPGIVSVNDGGEWEWILGQLAEIVPRFEVQRVSAAAVGAPQERERIWIACFAAVADDDEQGRCAVGQPERAELEGASRCEPARRDEELGDGDSGRREQHHASERADAEPRARHVPVGDAVDVGLERGAREGREAINGPKHARADVGDTASGGRRARQGLSVRRTAGGCESMGDAERSERRPHAESWHEPDRHDAGREKEAGRSRERSKMVGDASGAGREERDAAAESDRSRHAAGERAVVGESGCRSVQRRDDAGAARGGDGGDGGEQIQRERRGRDARDYGQLLRAWDDATPVRGADGTVRLLPREAAETGPELPLRSVADGLPDELVRRSASGREEHRTKAGTEAGSEIGALRDVRSDGEALASPSGLFGAGSFRDSLPPLPREGGSEGRAPTQETAEGVQGLRPVVHAVAQQETLDVQRGVSCRDWPDQCAEALARPSLWPVVAGERGRVARLRAIGNAWCPQAAVPALQRILACMGCNRRRGDRG